MLDHFMMFAAYNGWANKKLFCAAAKLCEEDYKRDCAVAFNSLHGTLNHLLLADDIWICRFEGSASHHTKLDAIIHDQFDELLSA